MKVGIFDQYGALNSAPVFAAVKQGLDNLNIEWASMDMDSDVAVIWSVVWNGRMRLNYQVWQHFRSLNKPVLVVEVGMLHRGITWKLGINGTGSTAYYGSTTETNRAKRLDLSLHPWTNHGDNIIIALQRTDSLQWNGQPGIDEWLRTTISTLHQYTDKQIIVRPHPRQKVPSIKGVVFESPLPIAGTYDGFNFSYSLSNAWAVINHNSGPGTQAIMHGVPAFVDSSSLAAPVGNIDLSTIETPSRPDRTQWLETIAHTEWTVSEIATGYPLQRLLFTVPS